MVLLMVAYLASLKALQMAQQKEQRTVVYLACSTAPTKVAYLDAMTVVRMLMVVMR